MQFLIDITLTLFYLFAFFLICAWSWRFWKMYINQKWLSKYQSEMLLLEIKLPRDIYKSPQAMEMALTGLLQSSGVSTWYDRNVKGQLVNYFSLEIASLEGVIHFYIKTHKKFRSLIEGNLYAQYPGIEIVEADDYTSLIRYHHLSKDTEMWGNEYPLGKKWDPTDEYGKPYKNKKGENIKMPADFLPIKTYVDYGLDKDPKEEFKIDPITPLLEFMALMTKGQYCWYQILVQDESPYDDKRMPATYVNPETHQHMTLVQIANARKKQIRTSHVIKKGDLVYDEYGNVKTKMVPTGEKDVDGKPIMKEEGITYNFDNPKEVSKGEMSLTPEEKHELEQINRKLSKPIIRAVIRLIFVTKIEAKNPAHVPATLAVLRGYNHGGGTVGNTFGLRVVDPYDFPWQNTMQRRIPWRKEEMFEAYVEREGFFPHIIHDTEKNDDLTFWAYSMAARKKYRMIWEAFRHPFTHPNPSVICLNLEELASLWHFPGAVAGTPMLPRIDSNKGIPPINLPQ